MRAEPGLWSGRLALGWLIAGEWRFHPARFLVTAVAIAVGVAPTTYVLGGYYENHGISARLIYTFNEGSQTALNNQNGITNAALFGDSAKQLDFSGSVDLSEILGNEHLPMLTLDVINITKETQRAYFQFPNAAFTYYEPGRTVMVGLRGSF